MGKNGRPQENKRNLNKIKRNLKVEDKIEGKEWNENAKEKKREIWRKKMKI